MSSSYPSEFRKYNPDVVEIWTTTGYQGNSRVQTTRDEARPLRDETIERVCRFGDCIVFVGDIDYVMTAAEYAHTIPKSIAKANNKKLSQMRLPMPKMEMSIMIADRRVSRDNQSSAYRSDGGAKLTRRALLLFFGTPTEANFAFHNQEIPKSFKTPVKLMLQMCDENPRIPALQKMFETLKERKMVVKSMRSVPSIDNNNGAVTNKPAIPVVTRTKIPFRNTLGVNPDAKEFVPSTSEIIPTIKPALMPSETSRYVQSEAIDRAAKIQSSRQALRAERYHNKQAPAGIRMGVVSDDKWYDSFCHGRVETARSHNNFNAIERIPTIHEEAPLVPFYDGDDGPQGGLIEELEQPNIDRRLSLSNSAQAGSPANGSNSTDGNEEDVAFAAVEQRLDTMINHAQVSLKNSRPYKLSLLKRFEEKLDTLTSLYGQLFPEGGVPTGVPNLPPPLPKPRYDDRSRVPLYARGTNDESADILGMLGKIWEE